MRTFKSGQFWFGVLVGVLLLTFFPQLNLRTMVKGKRAGGAAGG